MIQIRCLGCAQIVQGVLYTFVLWDKVDKFLFIKTLKNHTTEISKDNISIIGWQNTNPLD